jgi:hypothetical protein
MVARARFSRAYAGRPGVPPPVKAWFRKAGSGFHSTFFTKKTGRRPAVGCMPSAPTRAGTLPGTVSHPLNRN